MKTESEGGLKKVLTTTLVSVVLSPIGVALGWYLSHELARPRLQLEFVDPAYHMGTATLSGPAVERLRRNRDLVSRLRNILAMNSAPMECRRWLDGEDWDTSCHGVVADASIGLRDNLHLGYNALTNNILRVKAWVPPGKLDELDTAPGLEQLNMLLMAKPVFNASDKELYLSNARSLASVAKRSLQSLEPFIAELQRMSEVEQPRTGGLSMDVGVLNAGESDGVVRPDGKLIVGDAEVDLAAWDSNNGAPYYAVVKAHSFESIRYEVNAMPGQEAAVEKLRALLIDNATEEFEVRLSTTSGAVLKRTARFR
jgi:hypothetical protein